MNFRRSSTFPCFLVSMFMGATCWLQASTYDVPSFHAAPFDPDGIFLEDSDRQSLLEALASIASNFSSSSSIDEDLVEKALAIALSIDPFHGNSRRAHEALSEGLKPAATPYFESRSAVAEKLWGIASELTTPPIEPEAATLAPMLMELSLLTHPAPAMERLVLFNSIMKGKRDYWANFVTLQPDLYPSTERVKSLRKEAREFRIEEPAAEKEPNMAQAEPAEEPVPKPNDPDPVFAGAEVMEQEIEIPGLFPAPSGAAPGLFRISIRKPVDTSEVTRVPYLNSRPVGEYPVIPILTPQPPVPQIGATRLLMPEARKYGITWQQGAVGEVSFTPARGEAKAREAAGVHGTLPLVVGLKALSQDRSLNPSIGLLGSLDIETGTLIDFDRPARFIKSAELLSLRFLLIPGNTLEPVVERLTTTEDLEILFHTDLLTYNSVDEALELLTLTEIPEAMSEAEKIFDEIQSVSTRMPLPELARNSKVQERLEEILALVPNHFSARAMLEFGRIPPPADALLKSAIDEIDEVINPYFELRRDFGVDLNALRNTVEEADLQLSRMRTTIPPEARDYHSLATDIIEAANLYLNFSNKTTSIAEQRLRELRLLLGELITERSELGLKPRLKSE